MTKPAMEERGATSEASGKQLLEAGGDLQTGWRGEEEGGGRGRQDLPLTSWRSACQVSVVNPRHLCLYGDLFERR